MGRRSLLLRQSAASHWSLELTSVSCGPLNNPGGEFCEISARSIYQLHIDRLDGSRVALDSIIEHLDEDLDNSVPRQVLNARKTVQIHERSNRDAFVRVWNLICRLEIFLWHLQSAQHMLNRDFMGLQNDDVAGNAAGCLEPILDDFTKRLEESVGRRTLNMFVSWHFPSRCDPSPLLSPPQGTARNSLLRWN